MDIEVLKKQIEDWNNKAAEAEKDFQKQIEERDFNDALKEEMEAFKFTSEAAKKAIMAEVKEAGLKLKDGKILGLSDLIGQIKEKGASAFAPDKDPAKFTEVPKESQGNQTGFNKLSLAEKMKYANEHPTSADVIEWLKK